MRIYIRQIAVKLITLCAVCTCAMHFVHAQTNKAGNNWLLGRYMGTYNFKGDTSMPSFKYRQPKVPFAALDESGSCISDSATGALLFFSNGKKIYDSLGNLMHNGDSIAIGKQGNLNSAINQSNIILPKKGNTFYQFNTQMSDSELYYGVGGIVGYATQLRYSIVDMSANNGLGAVVQKNRLVTDTGRMRMNGIQAVRHANGVDWWVVTLGFGRNRVPHSYVFTTLVTPDSVYPMQEQLISTDTTNTYQGDGRVSFSTDGNQIAIVTASRNDCIGNFNRCNGTISNIRTIPPIDSGLQGISTFLDAVWSPNGRYLYVNQISCIVQLDTWSSDPDWDQSLVLGFDTNVGQYLSAYGHMALAPDGRIYIGNWGAPNLYLQGIGKPDLPKAACQPLIRVLRAPYQLISYSAGDYTDRFVGDIPNISNYTLGADPNYDINCWPLAITQPQVQQAALVVYPNPAKDLLHISNTALTVNTYTMYNVQGDMVLEGNLVQGQGVVSVASLANGVYVLRSGASVLKFVKE
jgi:hypothetical protein